MKHVIIADMKQLLSTCSGLKKNRASPGIEPYSYCMCEPHGFHKQFRRECRVTEISKLLILLQLLPFFK